MFLFHPISDTVKERLQFVELVHPNNESFQISAHLDTEIIEVAIMVIAACLASADVSKASVSLVQ